MDIMAIGILNVSLLEALSYQSSAISDKRAIRKSELKAES
jgi:hypothetical protein